MDTYYEDILNEVKQKIDDEEYQKAFDILEEELSMPYIPREYESDMITYYNECRSVIQAAKQRHYDEDDIRSLLQGSLDEQFLAIEQLKKSNIRNHLEEIQNYLGNDPHFLVRSMLIEAMMEQNVTDEFQTEIDGMDVVFTPCYVELPQESDGVNAAVEILREWFESDNPTFTMMCVESLIKEAYLRLPFGIDEDEAKDAALAIAEYVFHANGENNAYLAFLDKKGLAQNHGYELLLNKHEI